MEGRRSSTSSSYNRSRYQFEHNEDEIKKGPWKAEEDQVLLNHVKKYGPRDWSSIRSKGLLQRTGKSCRLRWVNKLRPNLKNGVKFSAEEERTVIELQAQFGNKWARIATYLPGRTDNDVKNFWSSRQKRLARILRTSAPQPAKPQNNDNNKNNDSQNDVFQDSPPIEAPKFSSSTDQEESLSKSQSCSSSYVDNSHNMVPFPELVNPNSIAFESNLLQLDFTPNDYKLGIESSHIQTDFGLPLENQEFNMPNFIDVFGQFNGSELDNVQVPFVERSCCDNIVKREIDKPLTPDSFIDDFPLDMFDHIEPLPSPSEW
ncbi:transcription factor DUO1-like [Nicotiana sylvestris]|uniref:Transcription factor MYB57-like n=1 Tax=Nicotiana sylvestris TaxID=4096 RepID=A0A1U7VU21_NICSY|nr:PREDICTED: transcription factor MYB57-like [Nicotiana sylvestris]